MMKRERQAPTGTYNKGIPLVQWRKSAGLTQIQVAPLVGLTQATLSRIEKGQIKASVDFLRKIGPIYKVDVGAVLASHPDNEAYVNEVVGLLKKAPPELRDVAVRSVKAILGVQG